MKTRLVCIYKRVRRSHLHNGSTSPHHFGAIGWLYRRGALTIPSATHKASQYAIFSVQPIVNGRVYSPF